MISFSPSDIGVYYASRVPKLRQSGKRWRGPCPIHGGTHDSFSVDSEAGLWRCWSKCGRGGDVIALEIELTDATWFTAVTEIEGIIGRALFLRRDGSSERRVFAERRRAAKAAADDIASWRNALVPLLNTRKLAAVERGDDVSLARAASLCNLLENGSAQALTIEFIRHRSTDPTEAARLIVEGRMLDVAAQRITAEAVLLLALDWTEGSRDAA